MNIDWVFVFMVFLPCCAAFALLGWELCHVTHRQRGIEVDRPVTDVLPLPPPPVVVPDTVPDEWLPADPPPPVDDPWDARSRW